MLATSGVICGVAIAGVASAASASPAHRHAARSTTYFSATTTASAIHVSFAQSPADSIITGSLVNDAAGYATSGFDSGGSSDAAAAPLYPGSLVIGGPGLLCTDLFTCPFTPPAYPLLADATYPQTPSARIATTPSKGLGPVLSVTPSTASAHAESSGNTSTTRTGSVSLLGGSALGISAGSSSASTRVRTTDTAIRIDVRASVSNISVGPLVHIASVRTSDSLTLGGSQAPVDRPRVTVSGITVGGQRATITATGTHLAGHDLGSLAGRLARSGIQIRTLGIARTDHANSARSSAGGLEIDFTVPVTGIPYIPNPLSSLPGVGQVPGVDLKGNYIGEVQLGGAGAAGAIQRQPDVGALPAPASTTGKAPHSRAARSGANPVADVVAPAADPPPPLVAAAPLPAPSLLLLGLEREDLTTLYLVLALGTAMIFLGWRGSVRRSRAPRITGRGR
jgi:hypothetical protein